MKLVKFAVLTAALAGLSSSAFAQLPQSRILTVDVAQAIAVEAVANCKAAGYAVTVLVVDAMNAPKFLLRADGAAASTTKMAEMKAYSALLYNRPSGPTTPVPAGQTAPAAIIAGTVNNYGGIPIKVGDATIGAIAVSGAPGGDKDAVCANAALAKFADKLK